MNPTQLPPPPLPPTPAKRSRWPWVGLLIVPLALVGVVFAGHNANNGTNPDGVTRDIVQAPVTTTEAPATTEAPPVLTPSQIAKMAFIVWASTNQGKISAITDHMSAAGDKISAEDYAGVVDEDLAVVAAIDAVPPAPAGTDAGAKTIRSFSLCRLAYANAARSISDMDVTEIRNATTDLGVCTDAVNDATAAIKELSGS